MGAFEGKGTVHFKASWLVVLLFVLLTSGCASRGMGVWRAADLTAHPASTIRLVYQGQVAGIVSKEKIKLVSNVKEKIEEVVPGVRAQLFITSQKEPNAIASEAKGQPVIGISLGMLELAEWDRSAYAAVIGHEYAHLVLHHGAIRAQRQTTSRAASEVFGLILSQAGVPLGGTLANVAVGAVETAYTREEERDADRTGFEYLVAAGFDPTGAIRLWERMQATSPGFAIPFLANHPLSSERLEMMKTLVSSRLHTTAVATADPTVSSPVIVESTETTAHEETGAMAFAGEAQKRIAVGTTVWVSVEPVGLYAEAAEDSERLLKLYKKDPLHVEVISGEWIRVKTGDGNRGWIMRPWVGKTK